MKNNKKLIVIGILVLIICTISIGAHYIEKNRSKKTSADVCTMERC